MLGLFGKKALRAILWLSSCNAKKEIRCLQKYAKTGDKILDTHVGSASSLIACKELGFDYVACELDTHIYYKAIDRLCEYDNKIKLV